MALWIFGGFIIALMLAAVLCFGLLIKNTALKVTLVVVSIAVCLIMGALGFLIIGSIELGKSVSNSVSSVVKEKDEEAGDNLPKLASTNESKEVFEIDEKIKGNGVEFTVSPMVTILDDKNSRPTTPVKLCAYEVTIKNIYKNTQKISKFDFQLKDENSRIVTISNRLLNDPDNQKYNLSDFEVEPQKTIKTGFAFECNQAIDKPLYLIYKGGEYIDFAYIFGSTKNKFTPIKVKILT